ncbi:ABC transporter ATP-binding protein [Sphingomonas naphthae]|uniref:ABC transporter ATP-binding protein n=1 Tax=Sphingomonas naphthae TaxID=1813468 RepID=A0ABY7TIM8_9SPHN|nr:ABC transporter ATP-binding protein [Sphingomonas naphthae]WCT73081.1 ABC transporter ATP-binding protein [Sphingomonas naphthae]
MMNPVNRATTGGISIRNLSKAYGATMVLKDTSLEIEPGEFTVLLGPSGCGKSTLLSAIAGLETVDGGSIHMRGEDVTHVDAARRRIGMVFQSYALYPNMTVRGNLSFGLKVAKVSRNEIAWRVDRVAELLQITALLDRKPAALSGGQRQRVAIGRALVREADICLFDEPLSNLDAKLRTEMRMELKKIHRTLGTTMVYVTHDQVEALTLATRVAVLRGGVVEQYADPRTLYEKPETMFVAGFVGSPAMNFVRGRFVAEGQGALHTADGIRLSLAGYPFRKPPVAGDEIILGLRPEATEFAPASAFAAANPVEIALIEPMGADTLVWLKLGEQMISVRVPSDRAPSPGDRLAITFDAARASVFAADTGLRC